MEILGFSTNMEVVQISLKSDRFGMEMELKQAFLYHQHG